MFYGTFHNSLLPINIRVILFRIVICVTFVFRMTTEIRRYLCLPIAFFILFNRSMIDIGFNYSVLS